MNEPNSGSARITADLSEVEVTGVTTMNFTGPIEVSGQESNEACATCRFYVVGYAIPGKGGWGRCHRGHPTLTCHSQGWPLVKDHQWCGEYERATA